MMRWRCWQAAIGIRSNWLRQKGLLPLRFHLSAPAFMQRHFVQSWDDVDPLLAAFRTLQRRYLDSLYDVQLSLFAIDRIEPEEAYQRFFYHSVMPKLLESPGFVINVVRTLSGWPCKNREQAAYSVFQFMSEMSLPHPNQSIQQTTKSNK